jgi:hypothetical protein
MNKFLVILLILTCTNAYAAISKWVDSEGRVHYSDQPPPPDAHSKTLRSDSNIQDGVSASGVAATKSVAEREADLKKAQLANKDSSDKAAQKQAAAKAQQTSCDLAQQNLRSLQSGLRMVDINEKGEQSFIDDKQREERIAKAQKDIGTYCK